MADSLLEAYEAVPYDSRPIHVTHVSSLELIAMLHGLSVPASDRCSVLELGCASGGNLIPMAVSLPGTRFVGVDLAPSQVAAGQEIITSLGLGNISLHAMSIADITADFGCFDYIVCHGVYSWVPPDVQDAILRVCSQNLSPNGIAYVSYNTYPGWHMRSVVREMVMYHDVHTLPPAERIARARATIDLMAAAANPLSPYATLLAHEAEIVRAQHDAHLLHEQLEPFNDPVYFAEFARRASAKGLKYVAEAKLASSASERPDWLDQFVDGSETDVVRAQQYLDFARGRTFRRTLLCHDRLTPTVAPALEAMSQFHAVMRAVPVEPAAEAVRGVSGKVEAFRTADDVTMTTNNPMVIAALRVLLRAAPATLSVPEIARRVGERLNADAPPGLEFESVNRVSGLEDAIMQSAIGGLIELFRRESPVATTISERPVAGRLVRKMAEEKGNVPNLRHYAVEVSGIERLILMHLDGTNTRDQLLDVTEQAIAEGRLTTGDEHPDRAELAATIDAALRRFVAGALLEA